MISILLRILLLAMTVFMKDHAPLLIHLPLPWREQIQAAAYISGRATFPVRGTLITRAKFHNQAVAIPPLSSVPAHIMEHSYS